MKIAIFFPGIGYTCDKPLLYYAYDVVCESGYDKCVRLNYQYEGGNIRGNAQKMKEAYDVLYAQAESSLSDICWSDYDEILFVSKSVGTIISSAYAHKYNIKCKHVLYTPLAQTFQYPHEDAVAFLGTKDPWNVFEQVEGLAKEQQVLLHVYPDTNHSLEGEDTMKNLEILQDVMQKTRKAL